MSVCKKHIHRPLNIYSSRITGNYYKNETIRFIKDMNLNEAWLFVIKLASVLCGNPIVNIRSRGYSVNWRHVTSAAVGRNHIIISDKKTLQMEIIGKLITAIADCTSALSFIHGKSNRRELH